MIKLKAYAKINLTLDIIGKRRDGYHEIESIMQQIELADDILLEELDKDQIIVNCKDVPMQSNLAFQAAYLLKDNFDIASGLKIDIIKNIPIASGLSGGSADAAAILIALNNLWNLNLTQEELIELGAIIGSDVPFSIIGGTCIVKGRGELIKKIENFPIFDIILINPGFGVSTKEAYSLIDIGKVGKIRSTKKIFDNHRNSTTLEFASLHPEFARLHSGRISRMPKIENSNMKKQHSGFHNFHPEFSIFVHKTKENIIKNLHNDFEEIIFKKHPELEDIKNDLLQNQALNAIMSGSGSTIFGVFKNNDKAISVYEKLKNNYHFVCQTNTKQ